MGLLRLAWLGVAWASGDPPPAVVKGLPSNLILSLGPNGSTRAGLGQENLFELRRRGHLAGQD